MVSFEFLSWFGFIPLFNGLSTFEGYLMPKLSLYNNSTGSIYPKLEE